MHDAAVSRPPVSERPRWLGWLVAAALFALSFVVRALPSRTVFTDAAVVPHGNDAFYHLRRIVYSIEHFPAVLEFDRYLNFPQGAKAIWSPFFDWGAALLLRPFVTPGDVDAIERLAVWLPPLIGALTAVAAFLLVRRHFGWGVGVVAGLLLSVLSAHFWYSQIGAVDHHVAVALTSTWVLFAGMELLAAHERADAGAAGLLAAAATGTAFAVTILVWPGSLLHVGLVDAGLLAYLLTRRTRPAAIRFAWHLAVAHALAFLLVLPFCAGAEWPQWSDYTPVVLSNFQPWLFGAAALFGAASALGWRSPALGATPLRRLVSALALGLAVLSASAAVLPGITDGVGEAWQWLSKSDHFQSMVAESRPMFWTRSGFSTRVGLLRLSGFIYLFPVCFAVALWSSRDRAPRLLFLGWLFALFVVTALQKRFFNSLSVAWAILMAWTLCALFDALVRRGLGRSLAAAAVAAGCLGLLWPTWPTYRDALRNQLSALRGGPMIHSAAAGKQRSIRELAGWLRRHTPETSGWLDASQVPEYGVLTPWGMGHAIVYLARRPSVWGNFGDDLGPENHEAAQRFYRSRDEAESVEILERLKTRYIVTQRTASFVAGPVSRGSMLARLHEDDGLARKGVGGALAQYRLVFESLRPKASKEPSHKVFERVKGAQVVGRAEPQASVIATLRLQTHRDRTFRYRARAVADAAGRYRLRLPYPTEAFSFAVRANGVFRLRCGDDEGELAVPAHAVETGAELAGPALCGGAQGD